jgi:hypothetical protein
LQLYLFSALGFGLSAVFIYQLQKILKSSIFTYVAGRK